MHLSPHFKPALVHKGDRFMSHFQSYNPRDGYIEHNSGGWTAPKETVSGPKPSTTYVSEHPTAFQTLGIGTSGRNYYNGFITHYRQDGTGRDTYILNDNGGFSVSKTSTAMPATASERFKQSLRKYIPVSRQPKN